MYRIVSLPQVEMYKGNPYWEQLQLELIKLGATFVSTEDQLYLQWRWLIQNRDKVDILHLHHLQHHYDYQQKKASWRMMLKFVLKLILARALGYRITWTMHNLYPHQRLQPLIVGRLTHIAVAQLAHAVIVHCEYARQGLKREFYRGRKVYTIAHPSYVNIYPNNINQTEARQNLNLPSDIPVFLFLGAIRPYKGIEHLITTFRRLLGDIHLLIAGKPWHETYIDELQQAIGDDTRITFHPRFVPDDELQSYFNAADAVILPFADVLTSGSALLALSFGRVVVAPRIGCLSEDVTEDIGILYDSTSSDGLYEALQQCITKNLAYMGQNAFQKAQQRTWNQMAEKTLLAYELSVLKTTLPATNITQP